MDDYINKKNHQDAHEDHGKHVSHERNNFKANIDPPKDDNYDATQEHEMDTIKESPENKTTVNQFSG